jgi:LAO/AO transport system kinase
VVAVNPGWGDSVQAAKAGLLEIGDIFVVNKADRPGVNETVRDLTQMLELGGRRDWAPPIIPTVAATGDGIDALWDAIQSHRNHLESSGLLTSSRSRRLVSEMESALMAELRVRVRSSVPDNEWAQLTGQVAERLIDPWEAAAQLLSALGVASK